ncbi:MAG: hypothetical protein ACRDOL_15610 [Streptosporangiaceae bacterium]
MDIRAAQRLVDKNKRAKGNETREVRSRVIPTVDGDTLAEAIAEQVDGSHPAGRGPRR